jgi:bacteriocin-like protein
MSDDELNQVSGGDSKTPPPKNPPPKNPPTSTPTVIEIQDYSFNIEQTL